MDARWRLDGDALDGAGLRVALQRIGLALWQPQGVLRSWGLAPLHREGEVLCVPCADDEALWLGAWPEPAGGRGTVTLQEGPAAAGSSIELPKQQAITALAGGLPISRPSSTRRRELRLEMAAPGQDPLSLVLALLDPADWSALAGRAWAPLAGPPPRPPRLG